MSSRLTHLFTIVVCILSIVAAILYTVSGNGTDSFHVQKAKKHGILQIAGDK